MCSVAAMAVEREHRRRSLERRDALVRAAVEVAAEQGMAGVTHRAVTERAGLPLAAASYFWTSINDLAVEALGTSVAAHAQVLDALAAALAGESLSPDEVGAAVAAATQPRVPETLAQFEAYLAAARTPELRPAVSDSIMAFERVAAAALAAAGLPDPDAAAAAFLALTDGNALHQLARGVSGEASIEPLRMAFRALYVGFLVQQGHVDEAVTLAATDLPSAPSPREL